jgi:hypothetical protein
MICVNIYLFWYMVGAFLMSLVGLACTSAVYHDGPGTVVADLLSVLLWPITLIVTLYDFFTEWKKS